MINYAQIDENDVIIGIHQRPKEIYESYMKEIPKYDKRLLGKKYNDGDPIDVPEKEFEKESKQEPFNLSNATVAQKWEKLFEHLGIDYV